MINSFDIRPGSVRTVDGLHGGVQIFKFSAAGRAGIWAERLLGFVDICVGGSVWICQEHVIAVYQNVHVADLMRSKFVAVAERAFHVLSASCLLF